jgi:hypothetical protein
MSDDVFRAEREERALKQAAYKNMLEAQGPHMPSQQAPSHDFPTGHDSSLLNFNFEDLSEIRLSIPPLNENDDLENSDIIDSSRRNLYNMYDIRNSISSSSFSQVSDETVLDLFVKDPTAKIYREDVLAAQEKVLIRSKGVRPSIKLALLNLAGTEKSTCVKIGPEKKTSSWKIKGIRML